MISVIDTDNFESATFDMEPKESQKMTLEQMGHYVKVIRKEKGLDQSALAELSGVKQPTISRIEKGKKVGSEALDKVVEALGVEVQLTIPRR